RPQGRAKFRIDQIQAMCVRWSQEDGDRGRGGLFHLDDNLKHLIKELGAAINDALSESEGISDAIQNVRNAGYDVFLVLEATIGLNKKAKTENAEEPANALKSADMKLRVTAQDLKFLRSLKISVEDLDEQ